MKRRQFTFKFSLPQPELTFNWRAWLPTRGNFLFTLVLIGILLWAQSVGAVPFQAESVASTSTIAYQGRLADSGGNPLTDTLNMSFRLYGVSSNGSPLWTEQWTGSNGVQVSDGLFNVMLGSLTPIPATVITGNTSLFLGITVGTDDEMTPRVQLGTVPYAVQALTVPDGSITKAKLAPDAMASKLEHQSVVLGTFSTASTTFVDIPGSAITTTVQSPTTLMVTFSGSLYTMMQANSYAGAILTISHNGVDKTDLVNQDLAAWNGACCSPNPAITPAGFSVLIPVEAGTHVVKLRVLASSYNPSYIGAGIGYNGRASSFSVIVLGS